MARNAGKGDRDVEGDKSLSQARGEHRRILHSTCAEYKKKLRHKNEYASLEIKMQQVVSIMMVSPKSELAETIGRPRNRVMMAARVQRVRKI